MRRSALLFFASLALISCGGASNKLRAHAASDLRCDAASLQLDEKAMRLKRASGCGKDNFYVFNWINNTYVSPLDRAAFEMSCTRDQLQPVQIDDKTIGVTGCGKKAVYVLLVNDQEGPTWVLNSGDGAKSKEQSSPP